MNKKFDIELNNLIKIGIPHNMAYLITAHKFGKTEIVDELIEEVKEEQKEIQECLKDFVELKNNNLELINNDKNTNENI